MTDEKKTDDKKTGSRGGKSTGSRSPKPAAKPAAKAPTVVRQGRPQREEKPAAAAPVAPKMEKAQSFAELKAATRATNVENAKASQNKVHVQKLNAHGVAQTRGARKDAVARVFLKPGSGKVIVNGRDITVYFARPVLRMIINQPFQAAAREGQYDVMVNVRGGGLSGQAGAVRHGISRALCDYEPDLRKVLKAAGFLTRDARMVERKKPGLAKARARYQFSKR